MSSNFIAYLKCVSNELDEINKSDEEINEKFEPEQKMKNEEKLHRIKKRKDSRDIEESEDEGHVNGNCVIMDRLRDRHNIWSKIIDYQNE